MTVGLAFPATAQMNHDMGGMKNMPMSMEHGMKQPANLDLATSKPTDRKNYVASLAAAKPPATINRIHSWVLTLRDADGKPVEGAKISVNGGMPAHGHGFPTTPRVTKYLGGGRYLIEGVKFNMGGWWQFKFAITAPVTDSVTFNVVMH